MKQGLFLIIISLLLFTACDDGLGEEDSYIKVPAIFGSQYDMGSIGRVLIGSFISNSEVVGLGNPNGIAFDENRGILFWTDVGYKQIVRYDPETEEQSTIVSGLDTPEDIDFDPVERKIYWCDSVLKTVSRCNEWGGSVETLISGLNAPRGLTLDIDSRHIYFTDEGDDIIQRCNLDGSDQITVVSTPSPAAIAYHSGQKKIYWANRGDDEIWRSNSNGSTQEWLLSAANPKGIALDEKKGYLYYTYNDGIDHFYQCLLNGSQNELISDTIGNIPFMEYGFIRFETNNNLGLPEFPSINF